MQYYLANLVNNLVVAVVSMMSFVGVSILFHAFRQFSGCAFEYLVIYHNIFVLLYSIGWNCKVCLFYSIWIICTYEMITTTNTIYFEIDNTSPLSQMKICAIKNPQFKKKRGPIHVEVSILTCMHDLNFMLIF